MSANRKTIDTDMLYVRQIQARTSMNQLIPDQHVLVSNGDGSTRWDSISSIAPVSTFVSIQGSSGPRVYADNNVRNIQISTTGPPGLLTSYIDTNNNALMLSNVPPTVNVSRRPVPAITPLIANSLPDIVQIQNYSTIQLAGARDVLLSTVTGAGVNAPTVFISISSFTSQGYSTISGETFAWRPYMYSTLSTMIGRPSFISSMPISWAPGLQPLSTIEEYPNYSTGDVYFTSLSFNPAAYIDYIQPGVTKMIVEAEPTYTFSRFFLGTEASPNLLKNISSYIQYTRPVGTPLSTIFMPESQNTDWIVSQQSNAYTSNVFNKSMNLPLSSGTVYQHWLVDGAGGYYTLYHRIPGGMATLVSEDSCGYAIGARGGMSNENPQFMNLTPPQNGAFMHIYNRAPLP